MEPRDREGFIAAARTFIDKPSERERTGRAGRTFAEATFKIEKISDSFELVIREAVRSRGRSRHRKRTPSSGAPNPEVTR